MNTNGSNVTNINWANIRKNIETINNTDFHEIIDNLHKAKQINQQEMIEKFKDAINIDKEALAKNIESAPKIANFISNNDLQEIAIDLSQYSNISKTIQKQIIYNVANTRIRFDKPTQEYKVKPINQKEIIKDYTPIYDFAIKWNEKLVFGTESGCGIYSIINNTSLEYTYYICFIHFVIAIILVGARNKHQEKHNKNKKE